MEVDHGQDHRGRVRRASAFGSLLGAGLTLVLALGLGGCGGSTLARLDRGAFARAESGTQEPVVVYFHKGEEVVPSGTPVQVLSDAEGGVGDTDRKVLVAFRSGPHEGIGAFVRRRDLQPDPH